MDLKNELLLAWRVMLVGVRRPSEQFRDIRGEAFLRRPALVGCCAFLLGLGLLLFATSWFRAHDLALLGSGPWRKLMFPVLWAILLGAAAGFRFFATKVLEDRPVAFSPVLALTLYASVPTVSVGALAGLVQNILPLSPLDGGAYAAWMGCLLVALFVGFFLDARVYMAGARNAFGQNTGRAFLSWVSPAVGWAAILGLIYVLLMIGAAVA